MLRRVVLIARTEGLLMVREPAWPIAFTLMPLGLMVVLNGAFAKWLARFDGVVNPTGAELSVGGQSALFTGQVAPSYAPELELLGVVATAPAAELTRILERDLPTITGRVLGPEALVAWSEVYPGTELSSLVTGAAEDDVRAIAEGCIETTSQLAVLLPRVLLLGKDWLTFEQVDTEPWRRHIEENTPGAARIDVPILMTQGLDDTVVWADLNVDWARSACDRGESVEVITLPGVGHDGAGQASAPDVVPWITDRFAGDPAADGCDDLPDVPAPSGTPEADAEQRDPDNDLSTEE